jgi:hypothetical protein
VNWDCSKEGFEGIRAQDILPLLVKIFNFKDFLGFLNITTVFIDRAFGHNFDPSDPKDRFLIDTIAILDDYYIEKGIIKPTQMVAAIGKKYFPKKNYYKNITPQFSIRWPKVAEKYPIFLEDEEKNKQ